MTFPNVVFIRHKVMNFRKWKAVFEAHSAARVALGCQGHHIFRRADNPKELVVMSAGHAEISFGRRHVAHVHVRK
jgi:hypothetical protein